MSTGTAIHPHRRPRRLRSALGALGVLLIAAILLMLVVDRLFFAGSSRPVGAGSGGAATEARSLPPFTGIDLAGANNVIVRVGERRSVVVHADSDLIDRITTRVRSGRLVVGATEGELAPRGRMFVTVSTPSLDRLALRGAGNIVVNGIESRELTVSLAGVGNIRASGTTGRLDVTISGAELPCCATSPPATRRRRSAATARSC